MNNEELASACVLARVGHGKDARGMLFAVDLAIDGVARTPCSRHSLCTLTAVGTSTLSHKAVNDAMEGKTVVEAFARKLYKIGDGVRRILIEHFQLDLAGIRFHQDCRQGTKGKKRS